MKAKMTVEKLELRNIRSTRNLGRIGHSFELVAKLKVKSRALGAFSGEGIDCPDLEWIETVDWYRQDTNTDQWIHAGTRPNNKNLYKANPKSQTFITWREEYRYVFARNAHGFPAILKNAHERDVKHWIARNGFEWELPIMDIPSMSLLGGSGGGGGLSLVIGATRRRVIRFELGFTGYPHRIYCAQILETINGKPTISAFIQRELTNMELNNQQNLIYWRKSSRF